MLKALLILVFIIFVAGVLMGWWANDTLGGDDV